MNARFVSIFFLCVFLVVALNACAFLQPAPTTAPVQTTLPTTSTPPTTTVPPTTLPPETTQPPAPKLGWVEEDGKWYYYAEEDIMSTGWQVIEEKLYYFKENGAMATGKVENRMINKYN